MNNNPIHSVTRSNFILELDNLLTKYNASIESVNPNTADVGNNHIQFLFLNGFMDDPLEDNWIVDLSNQYTPTV